MSVVQNPLIGRAKQKLGGTVFTTWKGINVIKGKPLSVANPRTDGQLMQRSAMTQIVAYGRAWSAALNLGFKEQAFQKSAFNAFVGYNLRNAFNYAAPPAATPVPADILLAQGTISPTPYTSNNPSAAAGFATLTWVADNLLPGQSNADTARVAFLNLDTNTAYVSPTTALRSAETINAAWPVGAFEAGNAIAIYLFFYNSTNRKASDSVYLLENVVA